jgi:hypothetical protein
VKTHTSDSPGSFQTFSLRGGYIIGAASSEAPKFMDGAAIEFYGSPVHRRPLLNDQVCSHVSQSNKFSLIIKNIFLKRASND